MVKKEGVAMEKKKNNNSLGIFAAIGIVGIAVMCVLPGYVENRHNKLLMSQLQNTINSVKTAISKAVEESDSGSFADLVQTPESRTNFLKTYFDLNNICFVSDNTDNMGKCLHSVYISSDKKTKVTSIEELENGGLQETSTRCASLNSGATVCIDSQKNESYPAVFIIDVNGVKPPNVNGKDLFWFTAAKDGTLWYSNYAESDVANKEYREKEAAGDACTKDEVFAKNSGCLSYITSHNWKFKY